jgi:hypothetical protein
MDVKPGLMLRGQHRPRLHENGALTSIFETKEDDVTNDWGKKSTIRSFISFLSPNSFRVAKSKIIILSLKE